MSTNGVIETASGDLLRAGPCDWATDGSFDASIETVRNDVPTPPRPRGVRPQYQRWNGVAWVLRGDVNRGNNFTITNSTPFKITLTGAADRHIRIVLQANAIINFLDSAEGTNVYLLFVQDAIGGRTLTVRFDGQPTQVDYPPAVRGANDQATVLLTRFARRLLQVGSTNEV